MKTNIQLIEGFEYTFPADEKIIGLITENSENISFILQSETRALKLFNVMLESEIPITSNSTEVNQNS